MTTEQQQIAGLLRRLDTLRAEAETLRRAGRNAEASAKIQEHTRVLNEAESLMNGARGERFAAWATELEGGVPTPDPRAPRRSGRAFDGPEYEALDRYLRTGEIDRASLNVSEGYVEIPESIIERTALRVAVDPLGGYAVRPTMAPDALVDAMAQGALRAAGAPERITDGDVYEEVIVSGDTAKWLPEIPSGDEHDNPDVQLFSVPIKKLGDDQRLTEQQRDDQRVDVTGALVFNSVDQGLRMEDTGLINGSGIGNEPLGMLNSPDLVTPINVAGTTANTISNTISDMGSAPKIINLMGQLPSRFHASSVWMMAGSTWAAIRSLVDAEGRPYFPEAYTGNVLVGRPVILNDGVPEHGADGRKCVIFGSFPRGFRIARKPGGVQIRILNERYADRDLIGIRMRYRVGGGAILPQAFRVGVV